MTEKLSAKRCRFTAAVSKLIDFINSQPGYACAQDQVKRSSAEARANAAKGVGISNSLHLLGLAADILIYKDGVWQDKSEQYKFAGDYWKSLGPDHCWGGDFLDQYGRPKPDGNHFSIEHNGVK